MKKGAALYPTIKPDISNVQKAIEDALNGLAYVDDKQIVWVEASKGYSERPCVNVVLEAIAGLKRK